MKIIDLSQPLYTGMSVFPGDPDVKIETVLSIERDGWEMRRLQINSHDGTHVNTPSHAVVGGNSLETYAIDNFYGPAMLYSENIEYKRNYGVIFTQNITQPEAAWILRNRPKFVGISADYEFDLEIERELLNAGIISYERLEGVEHLPREFIFYGVPLRIKDGDGSPVRAFAVCE